jgi:hypothetical protein
MLAGEGPTMTKSLLSFVALASLLGCSPVPDLTFDDGGTHVVTDEPAATEPSTCPAGAAPTPAICCGTHWCYGERCDCAACTAKCGDSKTVCCTKTNGPPVNRLTCKPLGESC